MAKYDGKIVNKIYDLLSSDTYTIAEVCEIVGISERCYYDWQKNNSEFAEIIARARCRFDEIIVKEAKNSLRKKVNGYEVEERKRVFSNKILKEETIITKHFQPDTDAIKFVLTNKVASEYQNRQSTDISLKDIDNMKNKETFLKQIEQKRNERSNQ